MPPDPLRVLSMCEEIEAMPHDKLREIDRETLLRMRSELRALKRRVDRAVLRLAFVDEQQLN
jgi:hypothetical protein